MQQICLDINPEENNQINNLILEDVLSHNFSFLSHNHDFVSHKYDLYLIISTFYIFMT